MRQQWGRRHLFRRRHVHIHGRPMHSFKPMYMPVISDENDIQDVEWWIMLRM
jgi:hypothetical protein